MTDTLRFWSVDVPGWRRIAVTRTAGVLLIGIVGRASNLAALRKGTSA